MKTLVGSAKGTGLHWGVFGCSLAWCLWATLLTLLELVALRVLTTIPLIGWSLVPLLETLLRIGTWTGITSRGLSLKPPLLGLHLLALVVNNNGAIYQRLKIGVCIGYKLELQTIIQTLEKMTLLISIISNFIWSIM